MGAHVQVVQRSADEYFSTGSNSADPASLPGAATVGNLIFVAVAWDDNGNRTPTSLTDTPGTTYTLLQPKTREANSGFAVATYFGIAGATNAGQGVVFTLSGGGGEFGRMVVAEASGLASDQTARTVNGAAVAGSTTHNSGNVTPADATGMIFGVTNRTSGTYTEDSDFTEISTPVAGDRWFVGYIANPAASAQNMTYTSADSEHTVSQIVAFVGASAGGDPEGSLIGGKLLKGLLTSGVLIQ